MKKSGKKLIGSLMVGVLIATIGVVFVNAQADASSEANIQQFPFKGERQMFGRNPSFSELTEEQQTEIEALKEELKEQGAAADEIRKAVQEKIEEYGIIIEKEYLNENIPSRMKPGLENNLFEVQPYLSYLTEEQLTELKTIIADLTEQEVGMENIRAAIQEKLEEYGVLDQQLDDEIEQAEQRLALLNRQKELRDQGYSWEKIQQVIEDEFDVPLPTMNQGNNMMFGQGHGRGPCKYPNDLSSSEEIE